jgi:drug/metabolite transporter (DMT)-like permease
LFAVASGALASGLGYAVWYSALTGMLATTAAAVQLSVPVLAAAGGVFFLGEPVTLRLLLSSLAILGGLALFIAQRRSACQYAADDVHGGG